jgi:hypothetical protein
VAAARCSVVAAELLIALPSVEFIEERSRSARSKEVSPIRFVHSRVPTPWRWSF